MKSIRLAACAVVAFAFVAACRGPSESEVVGIYEIDKASLKAVVLASPAGKQGSSEDHDRLLATMSATIELKADGTCTMTSKGMNQPPTSSCRWRLDGDGLTLISPHEQGENTVEYADGTIAIDGAPLVAGSLLFRRRAAAVSPSAR